jgi:quercetin dioxygenase-like cupin family protein
VPIIARPEAAASPGAEPGLATRTLLGRDLGSEALHIEEVTLAPEARIPRTVNPHCEAAIIVLEGRLDAQLGRERRTIGAGDTVLAPAGTAHGFLNRYAQSARLLFVYPTHLVERVPVSIPGATTGFLSEEGLKGYESPQDRPLGEGR